MAVLAERLPHAEAPRRRRRPGVRASSFSSAVERLEYIALRGAMGALAALPLWLALRVGELTAFLGYLVDLPHRRIGMRNLALAFPEKALRERRRILRASFLNLGRMAAELAHLPHLSAARLREMVSFEDEAWWAEAVGWERSTGVLILSRHFGNWELFVHAHGMRGHTDDLVHRAIANPFVARWLQDVRARAESGAIRT